jgi:hypothetical protein
LSRIETYSPSAKGVPAEAVSGFVIISAGGIVVEHPAGVLGAAGFVDEPPDLLVVPVPEPADATMLAVLLRWAP